MNTLDLTTVGDGLAYKSTPLVVTAAPSVTPKLTTGMAIIEE